MTVCIFAKEPLAGHVKTRLAASIGELAAAQLAAAFLRDTLALVRALGLPVVVAWSGEPQAAPRDTEVWQQGEGCLGERLERVLGRALTRSGWAIALGADSPGLPARNLQAGVEALRTHDAVVGPCRDGGYYLLGLTRLEPALLRGVPWSTAVTRVRTLERLRARHYCVAILKTWFDVDEGRDLKRLTALLRRRVVCAEETSRVLCLEYEAQDDAVRVDAAARRT
jgi:rSAM/selenodomain-associated transferase 1